MGTTVKSYLWWSYQFVYDGCVFGFAWAMTQKTSGVKFCGNFFSSDRRKKNQLL